MFGDKEKEMLTRSRSLTAAAAILLAGAGLTVAQDREVRQAERAADRAADAAQDSVRDAAPPVRDALPRNDAPPSRPAAPVRPAAPAPEAEETVREAAPAREPAAPAEGAERSASTQTYRAKQVLGAKLSITGNISIGTVDDIVFADDGYIEYLIVQNEGKMVTVPWEAAKFDFEKRTATINVTQEQFKQVPTYTPTQYPTYSAPTYRTQIYKAWGITSGQDRRVDRRIDRRS
jgi:hypothetical protein